MSTIKSPIPLKAHAMLIVRLSKILLAAGVALTCSLAALDNMVNPEDNYSFVQHVMSMDTVKFSTNIKDRSITNPTLHKIAFGIIVTGETLTGLLLWIGVILMLVRLRATATRFAQAKVFAIAGLTIGFSVWQAGFLGIGAEWFSMWMSKTWNGQEAAFRFAMIVIGVLIYLVLPEQSAEG